MYISADFVAVQHGKIRDQGIVTGRFFEPLMVVQPDRTDFLPVLEKHRQTFKALYL